MTKRPSMDAEIETTIETGTGPIVMGPNDWLQPVSARNVPASNSTSDTSLPTSSWNSCDGFWKAGNEKPPSEAVLLLSCSPNAALLLPKSPFDALVPMAPRTPLAPPTPGSTELPEIS